MCIALGGFIVRAYGDGDGVGTWYDYSFREGMWEKLDRWIDGGWDICNMS